MGGQTSSPVEHNGSELTVLSWNIDGLHKMATERCSHICKNVINELQPDVVLLQEVVSDTLDMLKVKCGGDYSFTNAKVEHYFNTIMLKKDTCKNIAREGKVVFSNSVMGRYLLIQRMKICNVNYTVMTSHLESMVDYGARRKEQMGQAFAEMMNRSKESNVVFAGDMNIRDFEVDELGGLPEGIVDAWEVCGSEEETKFSWDMKLNDNLNFKDDGRELPRNRYDRMYYTSMGESGISCTKYELIGKERIESLGVFPSDHFGLLVTFNLS